MLQRKLSSLPNVDVIVSARTTEVFGDGEEVTGLVCEDRGRPDRDGLEIRRFRSAVQSF